MSKTTALTVVLDHPISEEEAANLITAIQAFRCVAKVEPQLVTAEFYFAKVQVKRELISKLWKILEE